MNSRAPQALRVHDPGTAIEVKNKKVTVVGFGRSGLSAARLLVRHGALVSVTDRRPPETLGRERSSLGSGPIRFFLGGHPEEAFQGADLIVLSPGVPGKEIEPLRAAEAAGVPVIGELELAFRFARAPVAGVTGTNGKSTTTVLLGEILKAGGYTVFVGGNLGRPLCEAAGGTEAGEAAGEWDWIVAEVSSFQLESIRSFRPRVAAYLNAAPNHLDRYPDLEAYLSAKRRMFENQSSDDTAVLNAEDPLVVRERTHIRSQVRCFGRTVGADPGVYLEKGRLVATLAPGGEAGPPRTLLRESEIPLRGSHNAENVMAAAAMGLICGAGDEAVRTAVAGFHGLAHRLEPVGRRREVLYVNDSKATTPAALARALESFTEPIVLIAGGRAKGGDFSTLRELLARKVRTAVLLGEARSMLRSAWSGAVEVEEAATLEEAVEMAADRAHPGEVVLFSPGCASFDMFRDFEDRGNRFKKAVGRL